MNPFEMVVLIVAITAIASIFKAKYRSPDGADAVADPDRVDTQMLADEVRRLRDRIAVLERIATYGDGANRLDREIEALRIKDR